VILFGGVTSAVRTRSTMELYVSEAEKILTAENDGVSFLKTEEIKALASESGYSSAAKDLVSKINLMPEQKVVIELPLFLKEFSMEKYLYEEDGVTVKQGWEELLAKHGKNYSEAVKDWLSDPILSKSVNPEEMARGCMDGMRRLADFAQKFLPDRPITIGFVGHSFLIDVLLTYVANAGKVTTEGFEKLGGDIVNETELATIKFDEAGNSHLEYRGKDFRIDLTNHSPI
jgi:hypothetical protein